MQPLSQPVLSLSHIFVLLHLDLFFQMNNAMYADIVKTTTLAGLCISVVAISVVYLMQWVLLWGNYPRHPHLILCVNAIPIITFCASLGTLAYVSPSINGIAVLGATVIACSFICNVIYILNVEDHVSPEP